MDDYNSFVGKKQVVKTVEEVFENIERFNEDLFESDYLITNLARFKDWYYNALTKQFGPKKFIGFKNMTAEKYEALKRNPKTDCRGNFDSHLATPILNELSVQMDESVRSTLLDELKIFLSEHDSQPRKHSNIYIIS